MFTAQWARIFGAKRVFVFDIDNDRLELAKKLGADVTINTLETDFKKKWQPLQIIKVLVLYTKQREWI